MPFEQSIEIPPRIDFAMILHITETLLIVDWFDITSFLALQPLKDTSLIRKLSRITFVRFIIYLLPEQQIIQSSDGGHTKMRFEIKGQIDFPIRQTVHWNGHRCDILQNKKRINYSNSSLHRTQFN